MLSVDRTHLVALEQLNAERKVLVRQAAVEVAADRTRAVHKRRERGPYEQRELKDRRVREERGRELGAAKDQVELEHKADEAAGERPRACVPSRVAQRQHEREHAPERVERHGANERLDLRGCEVFQHGSFAKEVVERAFLSVAQHLSERRRASE